MQPKLLAHLALLVVVASSSMAFAAGVPRLPASKERLQDVYRANPAEAVAAYKACMEHGRACQIPCRDIANCAGCHPASTDKSGDLVCAHCMPGHILSEDRQSCSACPIGSTSKGGRATSCTSCGEGQTTRAAGSSLCFKGARKAPGAQQVSEACDIASLAALVSDFAGDYNAVVTTPECLPPNTEVPNNAVCDVYCNNKGYGKTNYYCFDGAWFNFSNDKCALNTCTPDTCVQNGINTAACYPNGLFGAPTCYCPITGIGWTISFLSQLLYVPGYGCPSYSPFSENEKRCAIRTTSDNLKYLDACSSTPTYFSDASETKCTQVSIASPSVPTNCKSGSNCTAEGKGCWAQVYEPNSFTRSGWIQTGPDCATNTTGYLAPCPTSECRVAPSSEECKVEAANGTTMRTAPCALAPAAQSGGQDVVVPSGATFKYLDRNSRQSSDCLAFGARFPAPDYCWVLGTFEGVTGWLPVQEVDSSGDWTSALCTYKPPVKPTLLVSDDDSSTGCAQLTIGFEGACFPGDSTLLLRTGETTMAQLELGDEVAVRLGDGSLGWEAVYAFGHRDSDTTAVFTQLTVTTNGTAQHSIKATPDHFVLVGAQQPTYKRAQEVVIGDTMWVVSDQSSGALAQAKVISTQQVTSVGIFAPLTLSGSIIVDKVAASVHSTWFADGVWAALGLPDAWLHPLYQAALAPVRLLWHLCPSYKTYYAFVDSHFNLAAEVPSLGGLAVILARVVAKMVLDAAPHSSTAPAVLLSIAALLGGAVTTLAKGSSSQGALASKPKATCMVAALLAVLLCQCCVAQAARNEHGYDRPGFYEPAGAEYRGDYGYNDHGRYDHPAPEYRSPYQQDGMRNPPPHPRYPDHDHDYYPAAKGCRAPPYVHLPGGKGWSCPYSHMPEGAKCAGVCEGAGSAEITCTRSGWSAVDGACLPSIVCAGLPSADLGESGTWPSSCANTPSGEYCYAQCSGTACQNTNLIHVQCFNGTWDESASSTYEDAPTTCADPVCQPPPNTDVVLWDDSCREYGLGVNDGCTGTCLGFLFGVEATCAEGGELEFSDEYNLCMSLYEEHKKQ